MSGKLVLGDCIEVMRAMPDNAIDFILTDPPYLVNYKDRTGRTIANDIKGDWLAPAFSQAYRVLKNNAFCVSFYGWTRLDLFFKAWRDAGFSVVGHFTCPKPYASSSGYVAYQHESAILLMKGRAEKPALALSDVLPWKYSGNPLHPTQKPLSVLKPLIEAFSRPGEIVLDPFVGSGSTCSAALSLRRRYYGIEIDKGYFEAAIKRLDQDKTLFSKEVANHE